MERPTTALNSTDRNSRQNIYFSAGTFHGPSSLWMFYCIVLEALRKKKEDPQHALIDCLRLNICQFHLTQHFLLFFKVLTPLECNS